MPSRPADLGLVIQANARQVGGEHYRAHGRSDLQHWDMVHIFNLDYFQGQVTKYVLRWRDKNGVEDLEKAAHYLQKYIELQKGANAYVSAEEATAYLKGRMASPEFLPHAFVAEEEHDGCKICGCTIEHYLHGKHAFVAGLTRSGGCMACGQPFNAECHHQGASGSSGCGVPAGTPAASVPR